MIKNKLVYLSDDDQDDRELFTEALSHANSNFKLVATRNGQELLQELNGNDPLPDIIFLDINMPVKNGIETLKELRQDPRMALLPVVMYSTSNDAELIHTTKALGANLYFIKPADFNYLISKLTEVLSLTFSGETPVNFLIK
jgi:CheY-like chemotaxis protein